MKIAIFFYAVWAGLAFLTKNKTESPYKGLSATKFTTSTIRKSVLQFAQTVYQMASWLALLQVNYLPYGFADGNNI